MRFPRFARWLLVPLLPVVGLASFVVIAQTAAPQTHAQSASYRVTDLGTLGGVFSLADTISQSGQIAGTALLADNMTQHATRWSDGAITDLGTLGGSYSQANGINAAGQMVGYAALPGDATQHAFLWQNGTLRDLGTLGGANSTAWWINDVGQIAGDSVTASGGDHAFLLRRGSFTDLGTLGGADSVAFGINDAGQVVGAAAPANATPACIAGVFNGCHAFLWQRGMMSDLGTLGGSWSLANLANVRGQVTGYSALADDAHFQAFLWQNGAMTGLPPVTGDTDTTGNGINDLGQVVGSSGTPTNPVHAVLWQHGAALDLNSVIPASSGWQLVWAFGINDGGQIVGYGFHNGLPHAFLLTPSQDAGVAAAASAARQAAGSAAHATLPARIRHTLRWGPREP